VYTSSLTNVLEFMEKHGLSTNKSIFLYKVQETRTQPNLNKIGVDDCRFLSNSCDLAWTDPDVVDNADKSII